LTKNVDNEANPYQNVNTNINTNAKDINTKKNVQQNNPKTPDLENKVNKFNEYRHLLSADELNGVDGIYLVQEIDELSDGDIIKEEDEMSYEDISDHADGIGYIKKHKIELIKDKSKLDESWETEEEEVLDNISNNIVESDVNKTEAKDDKDCNNCEDDDNDWEDEDEEENAIIAD